MVLKRKRSLSELCSSPASDASTSSWPGSPPSFNFNIPKFQISSRQSMASPAHLNSRTMKRSRDNRPSEEEIYKRTLNMLFSAQRQQVVSQPTEPACLDQQVIETPVVNSQHSLHRFWNIGSQPKAGPTPSFQQSAVASSSCEDCGAGLGGDGEDDMMLDDESHACGACGKQVCFSCSISKLGENKRCLRCASTSSNSVGWTSGSLVF